jgi:ubiquitin thioesterase protein OTUB1
LYEAFVLDSHPSLDDFISKNVEPLDQESDQIHIVAMSNAFGITIKIGNLDSTPCKDGINFHSISPMFNQVEGCPPLTLLYRPGHYDILYF